MKLVQLSVCTDSRSSLVDLLPEPSLPDCLPTRDVKPSLALSFLRSRRVRATAPRNLDLAGVDGPAADDENSDQATRTNPPRPSPRWEGRPEVVAAWSSSSTDSSDDDDGWTAAPTVVLCR